MRSNLHWIQYILPSYTDIMWYFKAAVFEVLHGLRSFSKCLWEWGGGCGEDPAELRALRGMCRTLGEGQGGLEFPPQACKVAATVLNAKGKI